MRGPLLALSFSLLVASTAAEAGGPRGPVEHIYAHYVGSSDVGFFPTDAGARSLFTARMNALLDGEEALADAQGIGHLDFDPFVNAQDFRVENLKLTSRELGDGRAVVEARFLNFGAANRIVYDVVVEDGAWRIDDVSSPDGDYRWRLSDILAE